MRVRSGVAAAVAIALTCAACSSDSKGSSAQAATTPPTAVAAPAPTTTEAATTTAAPAPKSPEVDLLSEVAPTIDALTAALAKGDLKASQDALEQYDAMWNGVEVYTNIRS
ncbi:MAG: hypothetical protein QOE00_1518, partial [Ilumatobacteraceae bacterium]